MLACDLELTAFVLDLVKEPHVLDRYHRLVGEGCHQLDLLFRKGQDVGSGDRKHADRDAAPQHGHAQYRAVAAKPDPWI